jgi:murein endopeptidase
VSVHEINPSVPTGRLLALAIAAALLVLPAGAGAAPRGPCPADTALRNTNVRKGETLAKVAKRTKVEVEDLKRWNRLRSDRVRAGQNLRYCVPVWKPASKGSCNAGRLQGGRNLDHDGDNQGVGFVVSPGRKALFGTKETVAHVKDCCAKYRWKFAKGAPVNIGDLSSKDGGHLKQHLSHQSGRDVDLGYLTRPPQRRGYFSHNATRKNLDVPKQWFLVQCFLDKPDTKFIFLSSTVFGALKEHVQKNPQLRRKYLKFFNGHGGILKPDQEHLSHMHVRFRCPRGDRHCQD